MLMANAPLIDAGLQERLTEWGRWARQRQWVSSCRSIEGRYRPEAGEVWERDPKPLPVDARDAWAVECAWRRLPVLQARLLLRAYFVVRPASVNGWDAHVRRTCRDLAIPVREWASAVTGAARMLSHSLKLQERRDIIRQSSSILRLDVDELRAAL